jgi:SET domain-containing protein
MTKQEIIDFLHSTYCRIKPSKVHGVGVFAIANIPKGVNLFPDCSCDLKKIKKINKKEVADLNPDTLKMMSDFLIESKTHYFTTTSLNNINISYFLNHSDQPNCEWVEKDDSFRPLKNIKKQEELTINYEKYLESDVIKNV